MSQGIVLEYNPDNPNGRQACTSAIDVISITKHKPLYSYQEAIFNQIVSIEQNNGSYTTNNGHHVSTNIIILALPFGAGKTYISTLIAMLAPEPTKTNHRPVFANANIHVSESNDECIDATAIIVPPNLIMQWTSQLDECDAKYTLISCKKDYSQLDVKEHVSSSNIVLMSETVIKSIYPLLGKMHFKRLIIDEPQKIHLLTRNRAITALSTILLCATPSALVKLPRPYLKNFLGERPNRNILSVCIRADPSFIDMSLILSVLSEHIVRCRSPQLSRILNGLDGITTPSILAKIHGGDMKGALTLLGCTTGNIDTITSEITQRLLNKIHDYRQELTLISSLISLNDTERVERMEKVQKSIDRCQHQIVEIRDRLRADTKSDCPVCYSATPDMITTCFHQFCSACILKWLVDNNSCPTCRTVIEAGELQRLGDMNDPDKETSPMATKMETLINIITEGLNDKNRTRRFLVFTDYDTSTLVKNMQYTLERNGILSERLMGSMVHVNRTITRFANAEVQVLILNATVSGSGLDLHMASDVIELHRFDVEQSKQNVGRMRRPGWDNYNTKQHVWKLLGEHE